MLPITARLVTWLAAWTIYDVATLPGQIRGDVRSEFRNAESEHHQMLDAHLISSVDQLSRQSSKARETLHNELLASLK